MNELPKDIVERVLAIGKVEWCATTPKSDEDHVKEFADNLAATRRNFEVPDLAVMHGAYSVETGRIIGLTGTSPNSAKHAQAMVGAWNHLVDLASLHREAISEAPGAAAVTPNPPEVS